MRKRKRMIVHGVVQGVGFRPFVYGLAGRPGLGGAVWNSSRGVVIDVEGAPSALERFAHALTEEAPSLAIVDRIILLANAPHARLNRLADHPLRLSADCSGEPADLFDGTEIDQLLLLNILALTDEEKEEMRAS